MAARLLYDDFFRFLEALSTGPADPWIAYEEHYLRPHRAVLEAWWEQVIGLPRETWADRVRQVRPQDYGMLQMVLSEGDLAALAQQTLARCQALLPLSPEPEVYFLVGFYSPDAFAFRVAGPDGNRHARIRRRRTSQSPRSEWAIGVGLERFRSQKLIPVLLAHEYLHVFRKRRLPPPRTLGERMVEEGFAVAFSARVFPDRPAHDHLLLRPGQAAVMREYEERLWSVVRPMLGEEDAHLAARVIYGQDEHGRWPSRSGVYLGWRMVQEFLAREPGRWEAEAGEVLG